MNYQERVYSILTEVYKAPRTTSSFQSAQQRGQSTFNANQKDWNSRTNADYRANAAHDDREKKLALHKKLSNSAAKDIGGSAESLRVRLARKAPLRMAGRGGYR